MQNESADYAVIPFENSTNGSVVQTLDLLADRTGLNSNISVCGEHYLTVHHCLLRHKTTRPLGREDYKSITKLYTHPQAWGQCESFLRKYFPGVERQDVSSTSKAAEIVSKDESGESAAIASKLAGVHHGTEILDENIEDRADNTTRFLILRNSRSEHSVDVSRYLLNNAKKDTNAKRKTLISFMIEHSSPGALADALLIFKAYGLNLTSINSRPSLIRPWQYIFFVECEQISESHSSDSMKATLDDLTQICKACRDLGTWEEEIVAST